MTWQNTNWLFAAALTLHNAEEAVWLPAWSREKGYAQKLRVSARELRSMLLGLTVLVYVAARFAVAGNPLGTYLMCGVALTMLLNVVFPHVLATVILRAYAPGTATAVCLNIPTAYWLLRKAVAEKRLSLSTFYWAGPLVVLSILIAILALFLVVRQSNSRPN